jgi:hypothetical protein
MARKALAAREAAQAERAALLARQAAPAGLRLPGRLA